jgi:predicted nucleic acid-binding protein
MGVVIDTNVLIEMEKNRLDVRPYIKERSEENFFISVITTSELMHGVHRAIDLAIRSRRLAFVEMVIQSFPVLAIDLAVARLHAEIWSQLQSQGQMIGLHDSWIAASCLAFDYTLVTKNIHEFERVAGLRMEVWE